MTVTRIIARAAARIAALVLAGSTLFAFAAPARAQDADEAELSKYFDKVDVWHYPVDYTVAYNNQDVIVTRDLIPKPAAQGRLCYIRFDVLRAEGEYAYGFKPANLGGSGVGPEWGVFVHKTGTVLSQARSILKMNAIYFYVDGLKEAYKSAPDICAAKQGAPTPEAGHGYKATEWSDLIVRGKLTHGWPPQPAQ